MTALSKNNLTPAEYLAIERTTMHWNEYFAGEMIPIPRSNRAHNLVMGNLCRELSLHLKYRTDEVYSRNMRVRTPSGLYTYCDVIVACGTPKFEDGQVDTLLNPVVLMEVLSESTADYDRGTKFKHYRQIPSLREYVLVDQTVAQIEHFVREDDGKWALTEIMGTEDFLSLDSIGCRIPLSEVYRKVSFPSADQAGVA